MKYFKFYIIKFFFLVLFVPIVAFSQQVIHYTVPKSTGQNCSLLIPISINPTINGHQLFYGDEIGIFNSNGLCCGVKTWAGYKNISITIYGEVSQPIFIPGMKFNEAFVFKIWSVTDQYEYSLININYSLGNGLYTTNSLQKLSQLVATDIPPVKNAPILISPINTTYSAPLNTTLTWQSYNESNFYQIQISGISDFSSFVYDSASIQFTHFTGLFLPDSFYFWRVRAKVGDNWSDWSEVWVFSTGNPLSDIHENSDNSNNSDDAIGSYFNIYPNPCQDITNIIWNNKSEIPESIFIINSLGDKILDISLYNNLSNTNFEVDLSSLTSGSYSCLIETSKNKYVRKFVIIK